jgi:arylsulfatase A-like enzyme
VRVGNWKLVRNYPGPWELYDLESDRTEMHDLAAQQPDRVREMSALYAAWAERCGVIPREKILETIRAQGGKAFWEDEGE